MHDRFSTLNYVVLLKKKSDAGDALEEGIAFTLGFFAQNLPE